jgi:hypothetical protein
MTQSRLARIASLLLLFFAASHADRTAWAEAPTAGAATEAGTDLATGFEETLIATAATSTEEDAALVRAVTSYRDQAGENFGALQAFLAEHPQSGWRTALLTDLGFAYLRNGYFSRTIQAWEAAWRQGKNLTEPRARALVDRTVGELARLRAGLGHTEALAVLLGEIGERSVTGRATEAVQAARETLGTMHTDPKHLYSCGPQALKALMLMEGATTEQVRFLDRYRASPKGVSLSQLRQLAEQAHLSYRPILRKPGEPVPVPSIVHWKTGHFAAVLREKDGRFEIKDPVLGLDGTWIAKAALEEEGSGYFLAPVNGRSVIGWRTVGAEEAGEVWGAGSTIGPQPGAAQPKCTIGGMCTYSIEEMVVGLALTDMPVGYTPPIGPSAKVMLAFNQREDSQPANFSFFNVSQKWTLNWLRAGRSEVRRRERYAVSPRRGCLLLHWL